MRGERVYRVICDEIESFIFVQIQNLIPRSSFAIPDHPITLKDASFDLYDKEKYIIIILVRWKVYDLFPSQNEFRTLFPNHNDRSLRLHSD
jgi:hypothetical protein